MDQIELPRALEHGRDVQRLPYLRVERRILRVPGRRRSRQPRTCERVGGREQRDLDAPVDEPLGEQRYELLPRPVVAGRHSPRDRSEHRHAQRRALHAAALPAGRRARASRARTARAIEPRPTPTSRLPLTSRLRQGGSQGASRCRRRARWGARAAGAYSRYRGSGGRFARARCMRRRRGRPRSAASALGDPEQLGKVADPDLRVLRDQQKRLAVVREERELRRGARRQRTSAPPFL